MKASLEAAVYTEAIFLLPWAAYVSIFPATSEYDVWVRHLYLVSGPLRAISTLLSEVCKCLALEAMKRAAKKRGS